MFSFIVSVMNLCSFIKILCFVVIIFGINRSILAEGIEYPYPGIREVTEIVITGNFQTKNKVIISELPFSVGSLISEKNIQFLVERASENLLNTTFFNFVWVNYWYPNEDEVIFDIKVEERWYLWFFPIIEQEGRNFSDFLRMNDGSFFNYGLYLKHNNLRGRGEMLKLRLVTGYKNQIVLDYEKPCINNRLGWGVKLSWLNYDQMSYSTINDKQVFLKMLGETIMEQSQLQFSCTFRHNHDHRHRISLAYLVDRASDTLLLVNPNYLPIGKKLNEYIQIGYKYQYDTRDSKVYPLDGSYYELSLTRNGIGVISDFKGFFQGKFISSWQTPLIPRFFASSKMTLSGVDQEEVPYVFHTGLGYEEYLNGFEYSVIDGASYSLLQNKLLFELVPRKEKNIRFIPLKQFSKIHYAFYLKVHFDIGYVVNDAISSENYMANSFLMGYGLGLDLVTFYDKVLSLNYSKNNFGGEGFFVHFNLVM